MIFIFAANKVGIVKKATIRIFAKVLLTKWKRIVNPETFAVTDKTILGLVPHLSLLVEKLLTIGGTSVNNRGGFVLSLSVCYHNNN